MNTLRRRNLLKLGGLSALAAAAPTLYGCNSDATQGSELEFMYWGSTYEQKAIDAMLEQFSESSKGFSAVPLYTPEEYETKVNTLVASNRAPDVAYLGVAMAYRLAEQGKLLNLFPYLDKYPELQNNLPGTYLWYGKDKLLGTQTANEVMLLWYNKKSCDDAGVEYPPAEASKAWSWDTFVDNAHKLTMDQSGKHPDESGFDPKQIKQFGVSFSIEYSPTWDGLLQSRGTSFVDEAGKRCLLDTPEVVEVFQDLQDLIYKYHVSPTPAQSGGADAPATNVQLQTRRIAMAIDGQWILLDMAQSNLDYGIGVLPSYNEPFSTQLSGASAVFASTEHKNAAVDLFAFHNDPKHVDLYKNGLWMPIAESYYTDPKDIASWIDNDVHPPEFQTAVVDYTRDHGSTWFAQRLKNMDNINEVLTPGLQEIQTGKRPAKEVLRELTPKVDELLQGWHPTQEI